MKFWGPVAFIAICVAGGWINSTIADYLRSKGLYPKF